MFEDIRFTALAAALFVMSFGGMAWVTAGAPVPAFSGSFSGAETPVAKAQTAVVKPEVRVAALAAPPARPAAAPLPAEGHSAHDKLGLAALQASTAYASAPCGLGVKAGMIDAVSGYAKAWRDMMGCGPNGCDHTRLSAAAVAFSTPLDARLRDAVAAAFDKHGITVEDFPPALRINIAMLARGRGDPGAACPEMRADAAR
jgi:hypothetical protein